MLAAFWAVLIDLFNFVFPVSSPAPKIPVLPAPPQTAGLLVRQIVKPLPAPHHQGDQYVYVIVKEGTVYSRPVIAFDTQVGVFSYATALQVLSSEGAFTRVSNGQVTGFIQKESIACNKSSVFSDLVPQTIYDHEHVETKKIRTLLDDECSGGLLFLPLQPIEYILYELRSKSQALPWSSLDRPRTAGTWP